MYVHNFILLILQNDLKRFKFRLFDEGAVALNLPATASDLEEPLSCLYLKFEPSHVVEVAKTPVHYGHVYLI